MRCLLRIRKRATPSHFSARRFSHSSPASPDDPPEMIAAAAARRLAAAPPAAASLSARFGHTLIVPPAHLGLTKFERGVPSEQVRELKPAEKKWDFWSTSPAFYPVMPSAIFVAHVPVGEVWVVERAGSYSRTLAPGSHMFLPLIDKVRVVKSPYTVVSGVFASNVASKNGTVDVYAVAYFKVVDPAKSTYYVDPESNKPDSERTLARIIRNHLFQEVAKVTIEEDISASDKTRIASAVLASVKQREAELGLSVSHIEVRGAFSTELNVPDKLRALDPPLPDESVPGHNLSPDYWSEVLTPPYFEKKLFGSNKEPRTPAAVSLEWSIPSPPDFHHFNQVPKLVVPPPEETKKIASAH